MNKLLGLFIAMIATSAFADYGDIHKTECALFSNNKLSKIVPCTVEEMGGAGVLVSRYRINNVDYDFVNENGKESLNFKSISEPYTNYLRSKDLKITKNQNTYGYFCYKSKHVHFCSKQ